MLYFNFKRNDFIWVFYYFRLKIEVLGVEEVTKNTQKY